MRKLAGSMLAIAFAWSSAAHDALQQFVHHTATFTLSKDSIDVAIELTFYAEYAAAERARMDTNRDGAIASAEWAAYREAVALQTAGAVSILAGDTPLTTMALYDPEVDVHGDWTSNASSMTVRLVYFARNAAVPPGAEISVRDTLWLETPALCLTESKGTNAGTTTPTIRSRSGEARVHRPAISTSKKGEP